MIKEMLHVFVYKLQEWVEMTCNDMSDKQADVLGCIVYPTLFKKNILNKSTE
jgi:hypothetical protein